MVDVATLIDSLVVLGHPKNKSNPKTRDSWLWVYDRVVVFDPEIILKQLVVAKEMVKSSLWVWKNVLVICEKAFYKVDIEEMSKKYWFHYLNHKVPSWVLTNFDTMLSSIRSLKTLRTYVESDSFSTLTKKEQSMKKRELVKVEKVYKWVSELRKKPDLVVIVDWQLMHKFVLEVEKMSSPAIVLSSSNFDKILEDSCVVTCNINSKKSLDVVLSSIFWA